MLTDDFTSYVDPPMDEKSIVIIARIAYMYKINA
jgi:hypothetical protein